MLKTLFRLPLKRSEKPVKVGQYWVAKEEDNNNHRTVKKVLKVNKNKVKVSSSKGYRGNVCIDKFLNEFEIHQGLSNTETKKRSKKDIVSFFG